MSALAEMMEEISRYTDEERAEFEQKVLEATKDDLWVPNPGPQTDAYMSEADIMLYGGAAGGGKSHLELGWGINKARSGIIFRREGTQTDGLEKEGKGIIGDRARFNGQDLEWTWPDGKTLKLAGMPQAEDWGKHAGRERDFYSFDEAGEFLEIQVASILAWLRAPPGVRTRVVLGSNPPRTYEGLWMMKWFAPWLDDKFPDPAVPGELRWAVRVSDGDEITMEWVEGPGKYTFNDEDYIAQSYTFIPANLHDNPYRDTDEYRAQLQSLPEPLRSQLLYGKFTDVLQDAANQIIPTEWVRAAFKRWTPDPPEGVPMCAIGVDCSGGGTDPMVQAIRHDTWFAPLVKTPGQELPQEKPGSYAAGLVLSNRRDGAVVTVDMGGGFGGPLYEHLCDNDVEAKPYKGAEACSLKSRESKLGFTNTRSAAYWQFREALDPGQPGGSRIALKEDNRLLAGLTAVTFDVTPKGIKAEPKVKYDDKGKVKGGVKAKLGFSPDEADAVVMSWFWGPRMTTHALDWVSGKKRQTVAVTGRQPLTAKRLPLSARRR